MALAAVTSTSFSVALSVTNNSLHSLLSVLPPEKLSWGLEKPAQGSETAGDTEYRHGCDGNARNPKSKEGGKCCVEAQRAMPLTPVTRVRTSLGSPQFEFRLPVLADTSPYSVDLTLT